MNIMIVEDDITLNHGIALAFSNSGDTFFSCSTVREAKEQFRAGQTDMVILDVNLIGQKNGRFCGQSPGNCYTLLLAAGELRGKILSQDAFQTLSEI